MIIYLKLWSSEIIHILSLQTSYVTIFKIHSYKRISFVIRYNIMWVSCFISVTCREINVSLYVCDVIFKNRQQYHDGESSCHTQILNNESQSFIFSVFFELHLWHLKITYQSDFKINSTGTRTMVRLNSRCWKSEWKWKVQQQGPRAIPRHRFQLQVQDWWTIQQNLSLLRKGSNQVPFVWTDPISSNINYNL